MTNSDTLAFVALFLVVNTAMFALGFALLERFARADKKATKRRLSAIEDRIAIFEYALWRLVEVVVELDVVASTELSLISRLISLSGVSDQLPQYKHAIEKMRMPVDKRLQELMLASSSPARKRSAVQQLGQFRGDAETLMLVSHLHEIFPGDEAITNLYTELDRRLGNH